MRAAFERPLIVSSFREHRARGRDMVLASRVRRAGERNLLVAQTERVRGAAFDERQGLQRLDGGARVDGSLGVAKGHHHPTARIDDRAGAAMGGFDEGAAGDLDHHRIGHELLSRLARRATPLRAISVMPAKAGIQQGAAATLDSH